MATFVKFYQFCEDVAHGVHDFSSDTIKVVLLDTLPDATADTVYANITGDEIAGTDNGYTVGGVALTTSSSGQTSGVYKLVLADKIFTQSGANDIGPFRWVAIYNDTPTSPADPLIGYWDNGSNVTLTSGQTFTVDFSAANGALQIT